MGRWDDNDEDDDVVISVPYHSVYTKTNTNGEDEEDGNEEEEGENATMKLRPLRMRFQLEKHLFDGEHVEIRRRTAPKGPPEERDACKEDLAAAAGGGIRVRADRAPALAGNRLERWRLRGVVGRRRPRVIGTVRRGHRTRAARRRAKRLRGEAVPVRPAAGELRGERRK